MDFLLALNKNELKKIFPTVKEVRDGLIKRDIQEMKKQHQILRAKAAYLGMLP